MASGFPCGPAGPGPPGRVGAVRILVTGGAGFIGSHTVLRLLEEGHDVVVVDNLANSDAQSLDRVAELTGRRPDLRVVDLLDADALDDVVGSTSPEAVLHFAGLKAVGESVAEPTRYYRNNVVGTLNLIDAMSWHGCRTIVFSSSATVYGEAATMPLTEDAPLGATNPYGWSKFMVEQVLRDVAIADDRWRVALLRYFNPVGAHPSGRIGEDPRGIPNNLMPFIGQVAVGRREKLTVFGDDYPTPDGTCVRDYIHVVDLAEAHVEGLGRLIEGGENLILNVGTGNGHTVLEVIQAAERVAGMPVPHTIGPRRAGDPPALVADASEIQRRFAWKPRHSDLETILRTAWRWQTERTY